MNLGLSGREVVITGASRGIGQAIARGFAAERCRVRLVARNGDALAKLADELRQAHDCDVDTCAADLTQAGAVAAVCARWPDADILINNAGATPRGDILQLDEDAWRAGWELKIFGYINATRAWYAHMQKRRSGVILNVIGMGAEKLEYGYAAGSTGNAALVTFTRTVGSMSLDHGVRVLGVNPGWVETDKAVASLRRRTAEAGGDPDRWRDALGGWPGGRLIQPQEVADVVCFLASDRAGAVCGTVVAIDGGFGARGYPRTT